MTEKKKQNDAKEKDKKTEEPEKKGSSDKFGDRGATVKDGVIEIG